MSNYLSAASASSASSAYPDAAIENSSSDEREVFEEGESGNLVDHSGNKDDETTTDEEANVDNNNVDLESIFFRDARDIQNRMSRVIGTADMEDRRFRELFGARIGVVLHVWNAMEGSGLLPNKSRPKHLLWTLYFLKVYPRKAAGCSAVGGGGGGIDPKTLASLSWQTRW